MDYKEKFKAWVASNPQATKEQARAKLAELKSQGKESEPLTAQKVVKAYFPRTVEASEAGSKFPLGSSMYDAMGILPRTIEATYQRYNPLREENPDVLDRMGQVDTGELGAELARDPFNMLMGVGGLASKAVQGAEKVVSPAINALKMAGKGVLDMLPVTALSQSDKMNRGADFSAGEAVPELLAGASFPLASKTIGKVFLGSPKAVAERESKAVAEMGKDLISTLSGNTRDLLEYIGTKEVKDAVKKKITRPDKFTPNKDIEAIKEYLPKAEEVTEQIVDHLENKFQSKFVALNEDVAQGLKEMGDIDISDVILDLNKKKKSILHPRDKMRNSKGIIPVGYDGGSEVVNEQLKAYDNIIDYITGRQFGEQRFTIPASELYDLRKGIDATVNWDKTKYSTGVQGKIAKIPTDARNLLNKKLSEKATKTSYPQSMKNFHELLDSRDSFLKTMQTKGETNSDKVANFLTTLGNTNKIENYKQANELKRLLGEDLFKEANLLKLAKEYKGGLGVYNDTKTGARNTGVLLGQALGNFGGGVAGSLVSSPFVAAPAISGISAMQRNAPFVSALANKYAPIAIGQSIGE